MDEVDAILENYERDLKKAKEGQCKKISRSTEFRESFKRQYHEKYKKRLEELTRRLVARGHDAEVEERSPEEMHYGFSFSLIPRHLLTFPIDRFYPLQLRSSISFVANEHTLSIDVEMVINPNVERVESALIEKIPRQQFNEDLLIQKIAVFIEKVFNETIILDFRQE
jgi:uncharacterized protein YaaR (DUF327 family)